MARFIHSYIFNTLKIVHVSGPYESVLTPTLSTVLTWKMLLRHRLHAGLFTPSRTQNIYIVLFKQGEKFQSLYQISYKTVLRLREHLSECAKRKESGRERE